MARRKKINVDKCSNEIKNKNVKNQLKKKPGRKPGPKAKAKSPNVAQVIASVSNSLSDCESTEEIDHGLQILSNSSEHRSLTRSISSVSTDGTSDSDIDWEDDLSKLKKVNLAEVRAKEKARQKENEDPSTNDFDVKKMHEISRQYANNFAKNLDSSNQYEYYQERIRQLEEQLKDHNKKLNSQSPRVSNNHLVFIHHLDSNSHLVFNNNRLGFNNHQISLHHMGYIKTVMVQINICLGIHF